MNFSTNIAALADFLFSIFEQPALRQGASSMSMSMDKSGAAPLIQVR
jgi:hypothetical protein